jgi:hypothetical protein
MCDAVQAGVGQTSASGGSTPPVAWSCQSESQRARLNYVLASLRQGRHFFDKSEVCLD